MSTINDIRPQDDLFRHVNNEWLLTHEIPADRPSDGAFYHLRDQSLEDVRTIVESLDKGKDPSEETQQIVDLYQSFMDTERIERLGKAPLLPLLEKVSAAQSVEDIIVLSAELSVVGVSGLISAYVATDAKDISHNALHLGQSGLSLPDESYYKEEQYQPICEQFRSHVENMFSLVGVEDPAAHAQLVWEVEAELAKYHWNRVDRRDAEKRYNKFTWDQWCALAPSLPLDKWGKASGIVTVPAHVIVAEPSFVEALPQVIDSTSLLGWKAWLEWKIITSFASYLSEDFVLENFRFYGTVLSGTTELKERWKRAIATLEGVVGFSVGKKYVEKHFPPHAKETISDLVDNIIAAYHKNISALDWMTEDTKEKALLKLSQFTPKIGYPDVWLSYENLQIRADDLVGNIQRSASYETQRAINKIGQEVDRSEWLMTPQTVNAYYYPAQNEIVFPAAILQPPFFSPDAHPAANYGGIGAVIGHEIGHGFDDQGSKYDGTGALNNWWTQADQSEFTQRTQMLIEQYNGYSPADLPGRYVNGSLTVGENIGDLGGLTIALVGYQLSQGRELTPEELQQVFISWAIIWRAKARKEYQEMLLTIDPHSPAEFRCNGVVRNIDSFYTAFNVQPSDALYLEPEKRVTIW